MKNIKINKNKNADINWNDVLSQLKLSFNLLPFGNYTLRFEKEKQHRSISQNSLMWLWFSCIAEETGHSKDDVHDYYCDKYLKHSIDWYGNGAEQWVTTSTHYLTSDQFSEFLNLVQSDAISNLGIDLPNPDDKNFNDFYNYYINKL